LDRRRTARRPRCGSLLAVQGAWIVVLVIPCVLALLKTINRYYEMIDRQLRDEGAIALGGLQPPIACCRCSVGIDSSRIRRLRAALLRHGGPNLAVVTVPWAPEEPHPEEVIAEEEPQSQEPARAEPQPA
jgi:hypothetical protein